MSNDESDEGPSHDQVARSATSHVRAVSGTRNSSRDVDTTTTGGHETGLRVESGLRAGAHALWNNQYAPLAEYD